MKPCIRCDAELTEEALWCAECDQRQPHKNADVTSDVPTSAVVLGALVLVACVMLAFAAWVGGGREAGVVRVVVGVPTTIAVGSDRPVSLDGTEVVIMTQDWGDRAEALGSALEQFEEESGVEIRLIEDVDADDLVSRIGKGDAPDIALLYDWSKLDQLVADNDVVALTPQVRSLFADNFGAAWMDRLDHRGELHAIPIRAELQGLVWYSPQIWEERGYTVPTSWAELDALTQRMRDNGDVPWGVGIESSGSTGWVVSVWLQSLMLNLHGPEVYDLWLSHEIPFDDPRAVEAAELLDAMWFTEGSAAGTREEVATGRFAEAGHCVPNGVCMMHQQGSFYAAFFGEWDIGPGAEVYFFLLPTTDGTDAAVAAGSYAVALHEGPEVMAVMEYLASGAFADEQVAWGDGFISANRGQDTGRYERAFERDLVEVLMGIEVVRGDIYGTIPVEVSRKAMWPAATEFVEGTLSSEEFLAAVEAAWDD